MTTHQPQNVNLLHKAEQEAAGINRKIAILLTRGVGTMACAYFFLFLALLGLPGLLPSIVAQWVQWTSQTLIQLVMLSVIMVGQDVIGQHQALQADEEYNTMVKLYADVEEIKQLLRQRDREKEQ